MATTQMDLFYRGKKRIGDDDKMRERQDWNYTWVDKCGWTNVRSMRFDVATMQIRAGGMNKPQAKCEACGNRKRLDSGNTTWWISRLDAELIAEAKNGILTEHLPERLAEHLDEHLGEDLAKSWRLSNV
jgi:hypothetical protein